MKQTFLLTVLACIVISATAQIGGNAVRESISGNLQYSNPANTNNPVDLNPNAGYSYSYSSVLESSVMINVKASAFIAIFSLTQSGKNIDEVESAMSMRTDLFNRLLKQNGIAESQIFVDPVSMVPVYETTVTSKKYSKTYNEIPVGFEMKKNIHVTFMEQSQINQIISVAAKAEVYDMVKVDYSIGDLEPILAGLRGKAMEILLSKKEALEKAGLHCRFTNLAEKYGSAYPIERYAQYTAFKSGSPASYTVYRNAPNVSTTYNYAEKNNTIYYDKVSDKQFDKVLNPVVNEPMVQVYLSIKAPYQFFDPEKEKIDLEYDKKVREQRLKMLDLDVEARKKEIALMGTVVKKQN